MSCKFVTLKCINCKKTDDYMVYSNAEPKDDLQKYKNYMDYDLQICPYCGYISENVETVYDKNFNVVSKTLEYKNVFNYDYLKDYLTNIDSANLGYYPANIYECYAMVKEHSMFIDEAIRAYFKTILLKETIVRRYDFERLEDFEDLSEDENEEYLNLIDAVNDSIKDNINKILDLYNSSLKTVNTNVIYIECLLRYFKTQEAQNVYKQLEHNIDDSLKGYVESLIKQRR